MPKLKNHKHETFCQEYVKNGGNITQAMTEAGYAINYAQAQGYKMLENVGIEKRIEELRESAKKRNDIEVDDLIQWLIKAATLKIDMFADVMPNGVILKDFDEIPEDWKPFIQEIQNTASGGVQIKFIDKLGSIRELGKMIGAYEKDNSQKTPQIPVINVIRAKDEG